MKPSELGSWPGHRFVGVVLRWSIGILFVVASYGKAADIDGFGLLMAGYQMFPLWLVKIAAYGLPALELTVALLLMAGLFVRPAALAAGLLFLAFMVVIGAAVVQGLDVSCGCFGSGGADDRVSWGAVGTNAGWLVASGYVAFWDREPLGLNRWLGKSGS